MIDLIVEQQGHDLIVFDTAPTGHTLQLLRMPDAMTTWIQALVKHRRARLDRRPGRRDRVVDPGDAVFGGCAVSRRSGG